MSRHVARRRLTLLATATLLTLATGAFGTATASADTQTVGLAGWQVQSSASATQTGQQISTPGFATGSWLHVRPDDAGAVGTEVGALVQTGRCPNVFFSTNMAQCFGTPQGIGDAIAPFDKPWWFRTDFVADPGHSRYADLIVNGVVGQADVWVNGQEVATQDTVQGDYTRYTFDITSLLRRGDELAGDRGLPERPEHDVHARQRGLDPDPAGQQHRHPVPDPAAHVGAARAEQRARGAGRRVQPVDRRADGEGRRHQPRRHPADRFAVGDGSVADRPRDQGQPIGHRRPRRDADGFLHSERRPTAPSSTIRASGGPTRWAGSRSTACTPR